MSDATLTIPGLIFVGAESTGKDNAVVHLGSAVGWTIPRGVHTWSRELSVVMKEDLKPELLRELGVVLPEDQGDPEVVPRARRAAQACKVVAVEGDLADRVLAKGLRVHTVGFDRVSNGFFYFAAGGGEPRRVQGELIEIISPSLDAAGSREDLDARLDGLIDRLLAQLSDGMLSEAQLELAEALPALGPKGAAAGDKLQTLEGWLILSATRSSKFEVDAKQLAETLRGAARRDTDVVEVPLFGQARRVKQPDLEVEVIDGDAGKRSRITLPARTRWFVSGGPTSVAPKAAAATPSSKPEALRQPAARSADAAPQARANEAAARAATEKAAAERAASERAAQERAAAEKAAAAKAAAEKAAAAKAAAEKAAAEKAAAEKAATERAAAEKAAAERAAAERAAAERAAADKAAAERAAADKAAAERAASEKAAAERAAAERAATEKAAESKRAAERVAAEKAAVQRVAAESVAAERSAAEKRVSRSGAPRKKEPVLTVGFVLLMLAVGATIGAVFGVARRFVGF
jgi:hypothetical protein